MRRTEEELLEDLTLDDLQQQHRLIAETIGIDSLRKLTEVFGGTSIYIPQKRELVRHKIYGRIVGEYDGTNIRELAVTYRVSESTVYNLVRDKIVKGSEKRQIPGQMNFADIGV